MFKDTAKKLKICAYVYFFGNIFMQGYREIRNYILLGCPFNLLIETLTSLFMSMLIYFVIALVIFGSGTIIGYFEKKIYNEKGKDE